MADRHFRTAGPADAAAVDALTQSAYARWVPVLGRKPLPMTVDYGRAVAEHRIDILEIDGSLAALIEMAAEPDHLLIVNIAVSPDRQQQGLGTLLLTHAETIAAELGRPMLRLYTNRLMEANVAFYLRRGYVTDRIEERSPGWFTVHMSKSLA
jgi:GNAT superfamily N-acetyltransferase